jgi:type I restriction enzyme R subunit
MIGAEEDKAFVRDTLRFFEVERPTFIYKLSQAIADGYLVPYQIYKAKTVKTAAEGSRAICLISPYKARRYA